MAEKIKEIENLLDQLDAVRESFEKVEEKEQELKDRETEILKQVFESVAPIVEYVGDKQIRGYSHPGGQHAERSYKYDNLPSIPICVVYDYEEKTKVKPKQVKPQRITNSEGNRGEYRGFGYRLYERGLEELKFSGSWSNWQEEGSHWSSKKFFEGEKAIKHLLEKKELKYILKYLREEIEESKKDNEDRRKYIGKRKKTIEALESVLDL